MAFKKTVILLASDVVQVAHYSSEVNNNYDKDDRVCMKIFMV